MLAATALSHEYDAGTVVLRNVSARGIRVKQDSPASAPAAHPRTRLLGDSH